MLLWLTQYFDLVLLYTPAITFTKDMDLNKNGAFERDLDNVPFDFETNYIPYIKKDAVEAALVYDEFGVKLAKERAYAYEVCIHVM